MSSFFSSLLGRGAGGGELQPDTATSLAAARALALAGSGPDWWPYAALVTPELMAVHVAGAAAPSPAAPWRSGPDARLWIISRADAQSALEGGQAVADLSEAATLPRPILLGRFSNGFVYLDVARAPGPLAVHGAEPWAGRVRELLIAQLPDDTQVLAGVAGLSGAHWPVQVDEHGKISVLGAAMAVAIKSPERLDLPIAPSRRAVLHEMTGGTRQPMPPEDAAVVRANAATRVADMPVDASAAAPVGAPTPPSGPVSRARPLPSGAAASSPDALSKRKADPPGPQARRKPSPATATAPAPAPTTAPAAAPAPAPAPSTPPTRTPPRQQPAPPAPAAPAAARPPQRHLPAELYDAPAISAAAPAPVPAPAAPRAAAAPVPAPASARAPRPAAAPQRPRPVPPPPAAPATAPAAVEWNDVAVSSAEDD